MIALSPVEEKVARYIARGFEDREIADALGYSRSTIRGVIIRIQSKLSARNRTQIAVKALYHHIIDLQEAALG